MWTYEKCENNIEKCNSRTWDRKHVSIYNCTHIELWTETMKTANHKENAKD